MVTVTRILFFELTILGITESPCSIVSVAESNPYGVDSRVIATFTFVLCALFLAVLCTLGLMKHHKNPCYALICADGGELDGPSVVGLLEHHVLLVI